MVAKFNFTRKMNLVKVYDGKFIGGGLQLKSIDDDNDNGIIWCPCLNLIFMIMNKTSIWVYRINGERIYSINNKSIIKSICFNDNGKYFVTCGAGTSTDGNGIIKIYDSNNGNLIKVLDLSFNKIDFIQWNLHTNQDASQQSLFDINLLNKLPKVSSIDKQEEGGLLEYLVIVDDSNNITLNFNKLLTITGIKLPQDYQILQQLKTGLFDQIFLVKHGDYNYKLLALKYNIVDKNILIDVLIKLCQLIKYQDYVKSQLNDLYKQITPFIQLLDRYMSNLQSDINYPIANYLNDILLTGLITDESTKDFWLNQFGERGYKKLNKLGNSSYDLCRQVIYQHLISSNERMIILINDLKGISIWLKDSNSKDDLGLNKCIIQELISILKHQIKLYYKCLWDIQNEQKLFNQFLSWIKTSIIDRLSKEDEDQQEASDNASISISDILQYINGNLFNSVLCKYFPFEDDFETIRIGDPICNLIDEDNKLETKLKSLLSSVNSFHLSIFIFQEIKSINLPSGYTSLNLQRSNEQQLLLYLIDKDSNLQIMNVETNEFKTIPQHIYKQ
ncbi:uncharacterized protein J8A68_001499 [[Candida] subhashii]|uniref:Anaphase-promoting complex subunit 4 n=1 Tax=[Candida] subhashii TaxID=561895 RepID=A0A8J5QHY6_9ASCO|nr:uncharacterized protein J8A68_001499 [[Candida] subhashii]KAG7664971.1 hypothetical protein J8A68_001499 [[Candida] subhashii]